MLTKKKVVTLLICLSCVLFFSCQTSAHLRSEYVDYEFTKEGFLAPDLLQVVGRTPYRQARSLLNAQTLCINDAQRAARKRMLRIFLNTALGVEEGPSLTGAGTLETDYPADFSAGEYIEAEVVFDELLNRSYIALQDLRSPEECMLVFRLKGRALAEEIRGYRSSLESMKKPQKKYEKP
ncbi:MAG: hypothetical protein HS115_14845 [Spirochaetales bacterium]|nr:hypothetical protein [Spirochaetales bacterium]